MKLVGQLSYNGVDFGGSSKVTLQMEPVRDDADRTTIYSRYRLTVQATVYDPDDTGGQFRDLRTKLSTQGATLVFTGQGAGDFNVNTATCPDVKWGPRPRILGWAPVGSLRACEISWEVEFCLPACVGLTIPYPQPIMAFNFKASYSIDLRGRTTRRIEGYLEIPLTRSGRTVPNTADAYRSLINPAIPAEFLRITQDFSVSLDKSRLDFVIVDEETPSDNPYPLGVVRIDGRHSVRWSRAGGMAMQLVNRISVSMELGFNQPVDIAYDYFVRIVKERINKARANSKAVFLLGVSVEEGLFDRTASFSCDYKFLCERASQVLEQIRGQSGVFEPLTSSPTWAQWATSLVPIDGVRGYMGLQESASGDSIVDLCGGTTTAPLVTTNRNDAAATVTEELGLVNDYPTSVSSWMVYQDAVQILEDRPTCRQSILQAPPAGEPAKDMSYAVSMGVSALTFPAATGTPDVIQTNGQPRYTAIVRGYATRAGYNIPRPNYPTIGVATTSNALVNFTQWQSGKALGVPIYSAIWEIRYDLDKSPGTVDTIRNVEQS